MTPDRIKCIWCDAMILPSTADRNGGRCGRCVKINEAQHRAQLAYEARIAAGFAPTSEELRSAKTSDELFGRGAQWKLQPEYYAEEPSASVDGTVATLLAGGAKEAFLVSDLGPCLNLYLNERFGVIEYATINGADSRFAWSEENLTTQVPSKTHIAQACPCCGVALLWFHSHSHIPHASAARLMLTLTRTGSLPPSERIRWIDLREMERVFPGHG